MQLGKLAPAARVSIRRASGLVQTPLRRRGRAPEAGLRYGTFGVAGRSVKTRRTKADSHQDCPQNSREVVMALAEPDADLLLRGDRAAGRLADP